MLVQFAVGNYKSFKDTVSFSMVASTKKEHAETHIFDAPGKLTLLKSSVVYGANASGKSNLFDAMRFMRDFVLNSSREMTAQDKIPTDAFRLSSQTEKQPSYFQMIFIKDNVRYRYGFEVTNTEVVKEWLFHTTKIKNETALFRREKQKIIIGKSFAEGNILTDKTRKNALFLSVAAQFNGEIAGKILEWFEDLKIISGLRGGIPDISTNMLASAEKNELQNFKAFFLHLLKEADLGIVDISLARTPVNLDKLPPKLRKFIEHSKLPLPDESSSLEKIEVLISHDFYNENNEKIDVKKFDLYKEESQGTSKLYSLLGLVVHAHMINSVLIIDELDSSLHPLITRFIVNLFNSAGNKSGQLIFNTHDTNLLNKKYLRRDQIWFTEKDNYGATVLYSLDDFNVRNDASFEKDYLLGKYGSIPYIGQFGFDNFEERES